MKTNKCSSVHFGRNDRKEIKRASEDKKGTVRKTFSESFLFTLGLAFVIVYIVGLLSSVKATPIEYDDNEVVAVFAESDAPDNEEEPAGFWDMLDRAMEKAFRDAREDGK